MRLDKFLSQMNYGSRRDIKRMIKEKAITLNDSFVTQANVHIDPAKDDITVSGERVIFYDGLTLMINKPKGYVCANHDALHPTVFDLLDDVYKRHDLKVAGRLDIDTEGLLILSTDGGLIHQIISPKQDVYKYYYLETKEPITNPEAILEPRELVDGKKETYTPKAPKLLFHKDNCLEIAISEGKFHQVKRMMEAIGHHVTTLKRIKIHRLPLDDSLAPGKVKRLHQDEIDLLKNP